MSRHPWLGYAEAVVAASLWGSSGIFSVHLFRMGLPPQSVAILRPALGVAFLLCFFLARNPGVLKVSRRDLAWLVVVGGLAVGVFQFAYQASTDAVGVPTTVALIYLAPVIVVFSSGPLLGEWPSLARVFWACLTVAGVWLTVIGAGDVTSAFGTSGLTWGILAGASYAGYTLFGRYATPRWGPAAPAVYSLAAACVLLAVAIPATGQEIILPATGRAWGVLALFAFLTIAVAQFLFFDALGRIQASRASTVAAVEPVVAAILATLLVGQGLSPLGWLGIAVVVAGVVGVGLRGS
ncbi:MAG: EamA family transporter [Gemmatimonadota bacterium]|nr:EamA family transporter [Gemmatimonadota bacterium]MDH5759074.1 EamA family transporter [Gemmatimonadota bacterium]